MIKKINLHNKCGEGYLFLKNLFIFIIILLIFPGISFSQNSSAKKTEDTLKSGSVQATVPPEIKKSEEKKPEEERSGGSQRCIVEKVYERSSKISEGGLGDYITVKVKFLPDLIALQNSSRKNIILFINGLPIKGTNALIKKDTLSVDSELEFYLTRNNLSKESWDALLRRPDINERSNKQVTVSVGLENEREIAAPVNNFTLIIFTPKTIYQFIFVILVLLIMTIYLGKKTSMLKEPVVYTDENIVRPYSLALTQMAFWSFLIISSYLALFIITKEFPPITGSVLTLIGISSGTALGSVLINYSKIADVKQRENLLSAEKTMLQQRIDEIQKIFKSNPAPVNSSELQREMDIKQSRLFEIAQMKPSVPLDLLYSSKGFFKDMLSDSNGISLYRFQITVWTLVIGYIFVFNVWDNLAMPQFDNTLLALMGISSGTYLGFKIPEQK